MRSHLQKIQSKMDWKCDLSGRAPALQVQSPEFKLHLTGEKKTKKNVSTQIIRAPGDHSFISLGTVLLGEELRILSP
jgi:hypothetical protein